jgi:hypothetical protein
MERRHVLPQGARCMSRTNDPLAAIVRNGEADTAARQSIRAPPIAVQLGHPCAGRSRHAASARGPSHAASDCSSMQAVTEPHRTSPAIRPHEQNPATA